MKVKPPTTALHASIPYMGSKRDIAYSLIIAMHQKKPQATVFFDLFGGGGAMSFMALQFGYKVVYNEINTGLYNLIKFLQYNKIPDEWWQWVSREKFFMCLGKTDAYSQYVSSIWSFGNNGRTYIFGEKAEGLKRLGHEYVVNSCEESRQKINKQLNINLPEIETTDKKVRRIIMLKHINSEKTKQNAKQLRKLQQLQQLEQLERLQRLEQLEQLERLERLERLELTNLSYLDVNVNTKIEDTIIYCDPPYKNTEKYNKRTKGAGYSFSHRELDEWFKQIPYTAFMSEYDSPHTCIFTIDKRSLYSSTNNSTVKKERLYWNNK